LDQDSQDLFRQKRAIFSKIWLQYPAADDYHACTSMKVPSSSGHPSSKGTTTTSEHFLEVLVDHALADLDLPWQASVCDHTSSVNLLPEYQINKVTD
jgi:hypothetical protein